MEDLQDSYRRHRRIFFYFIVGGVLTLLAFGLLKLLFPFALAWLLALLLQPAVRRLTAATKLSRGMASTLLLLLTVAVGGGLLGWLLVRLATELPELASGLSEGAGQASERLAEFSERIRAKLPFLSSLSKEKWSQLGGDLLKKGFEKLSAGLTSMAGSFLMRLPGGLFVTLIFLMASFYLTADFERVSSYLSSLLPRKAVQKLGGLRRRLFATTLSYLKAYLILLAITFGELLVAFLFIRVPFAITLALLIALLDALPVLGVGTVLLPWGGLELLVGDWRKALLLGAVWLLITLVRQLIEPRIVGAKLGLHPLAALCAVWVGLKLLGMWGLFLAPVAAILLGGILETHRQRIAEEDR